MEKQLIVYHSAVKDFPFFPYIYIYTKLECHCKKHKEKVISCSNHLSAYSLFLALQDLPIFLTSEPDI